jgi:hypothetical protein
VRAYPQGDRAAHHPGRARRRLLAAREGLASRAGGSRRCRSAVRSAPPLLGGARAPVRSSARARGDAGCVGLAAVPDRGSRSARAHARDPLRGDRGRSGDRRRADRKPARGGPGRPSPRRSARSTAARSAAGVGI